MAVVVDNHDLARAAAVFQAARLLSARSSRQTGGSRSSSAAQLTLAFSRWISSSCPLISACSPRTGRARGEHLHVAIDDRSRLAYTQLLPGERKEHATAFRNSSLAWFTSHGVGVERVMTDNGSACKSRCFAAACARHGLAHKRTRPYTPKTNGKAERFIQSSIREWAYAQAFTTSADRHTAMHPWLHDYNTARPHSALGGKPPVSRLNRDNLPGSDS